MTPSEVLDALFTPLPAPAVSGDVDVRTFLATHGPTPDGAPADGPTFFSRLVRVALRADRRSLASVAGHQSAVRRLFPATPDAAVVSFCVSEDKGPRPSHIFTALTPTDDGNFTMSGHKRWGSMAPVSDVCYVAASVGRDADDRNQLRMVALPADRSGIAVDLEPYRDWGPEFQICDLHFDDVVVHADEVLPTDAYVDYIKPFRLIEDVYNSTGTLIGLFRLGLRHGLAQESLERLAALVVQASAIAETDMASPSSVLLLTDFLREADGAWNAAWAAWPDPPAEVVDAWSPERSLNDVAAAARETRRQTAWTLLSP